MKKIYFTPGPSQLYPTVPMHLIQALKDDICSISHRSQTFKDIYKQAIDNIRALISIPLTHEIAFLPSSLEVMEQIIQNMVKKKSFHVIDGAFSKRWYDMAINLGKKSSFITLKPSQLFNQKTIPQHTELICITHNETSIGMMIPLDKIYAVKRKYPHTPIALDIVSSFPYPQINFKMIDVAFFSVQKGLGLPAGLSILIVNNKFTGKDTGSFHSFKELFTKSRQYQTPETPNTLGIYLTAKVTHNMLKKGINTIRKEIDEKSKRIYDYFNNCSWGKSFIKEQQYRSITTIDIDVYGKTEEIIKKLTHYGMIVGKGYGEYKEQHIRIANFPQHSIKNIKKLVNILEKACGGTGDKTSAHKNMMA